MREKLRGELHLHHRGIPFLLFNFINAVTVHATIVGGEEKLNYTNDPTGITMYVISVRH